MVCGRRVLGRAVEDETKRSTQEGISLANDLAVKRTSSMWEKRVELSLEEGGRQRTGTGDFRVAGRKYNVRKVYARMPKILLSLCTHSQHADAHQSLFCL